MAHSRETEHYQLPLYDGTDIINPLTDFNNANEKIDETMYNVAQRAASAEQSAAQSASAVAQYDERVTEAEQVAEAAGIKADNTMNMIAEEFDPLKEGGYKIGDSVIYNQHLYTFINPHSGAWDASDVVEQPIGDALNATIEQAKVDINNELDAALAQIDSQMVRVPATQAMIAPPFDADKAGGYDAGKMVTYADKLYVFNEHHDGAWTGTDVTKVDIADKLAEIDAKYQGKVISSVEQFAYSANSGSHKTLGLEVINAIKALWENRGSDVNDIIIDGIEYGADLTLTCAWSAYNMFTRKDSVFANLSYGSASVMRFLNLFFKDGDTQAYNLNFCQLSASGAVTIDDLTDAVINHHYTINFHYLYNA